MKGSETKWPRDSKDRALENIKTRTNIPLHRLRLFLGRHLLYPGMPHPNLHPKRWDHIHRKLRSRGEFIGSADKDEWCINESKPS